MKKCSVCKEEKEFEEFNKASGKKSGLNSACRVCSRKRLRVDYQRHKEVRKADTKVRRARARKVAQTHVLNYLTSHPCVDCGEDDLVVLEFDHLGDKEKNVSEMLANGYGVDAIQKEIDKCEVRCCNCHRRRTSQVYGSYRITMQL